MAYAYHRDQPGAPTITYSTSQGDAAHFGSLKTILKACLVEGFGDEPPAGWELIAEGDNHLVLRNGSHSGYLGLSYSAGVVTVHLAATFLGMDGDIMQGDGLKSGTGSISSSSKHRFGAALVARADNSSSWFVVADEKTFSISCSTNTAAGPYVPGTTAAGWLNFLFYAGEDSRGFFVAAGGDNTSQTGRTSQRNYFYGGGFTSLTDPASGLLVDTDPLGADTPGLMDILRQDGNPVLAPSVDFVRPYWEGSAVWAGYFRGLLLPGMLSHYLPGVIAGSLGFQGEFNTRTANTTLDLDDQYSYFVPIYYRSPGLIMTDNPEFW